MIFVSIIERSTLETLDSLTVTLAQSVPTLAVKPVVTSRLASKTTSPTVGHDINCHIERATARVLHCIVAGIVYLATPVYIINWCSLSAESAVASVTIVVEGVSIDSAQYHQTESQNTSRVGGCYGGISTFYSKKKEIAL